MWHDMVVILETTPPHRAHSVYPQPRSLFLINNLKSTVMVKEKEGKQKNEKKEPQKNLKEKRAAKAAKKAERK